MSFIDRFGVLPGWGIPICGHFEGWNLLNEIGVGRGHAGANTGTLNWLRRRHKFSWVSPTGSIALGHQRPGQLL